MKFYNNCALAAGASAVVLRGSECLRRTRYLYKRTATEEFCHCCTSVYLRQRAKRKTLQWENIRTRQILWRGGVILYYCYRDIYAVGRGLAESEENRCCYSKSVMGG